MISTKLVKVAAGSRGKLEAMIGVFGGGWRNASKCKRVVGQLQARLTYLKRSSLTMVEEGSCRVALFLSDGDVDAAFVAAEPIVREENTIQLYDLLSESCKIVIGNLPYIRFHSDCPSEINKAVSTLGFAAPWCPELQTIRELFIERYGEFFDIAAAETLEGFRGSCVDPELAERLALRLAKVPYEMKRTKVCVIVRQRLELAMRKTIERPNGKSKTTTGS